ncbi:MAG: AMP-binding protein [Acidobacteriota bacterium]
MTGPHDFRTLVDLVDRLKIASPTHRMVLIDARGVETALTWREWHLRIRHHAAWLAAQGIEQGDRVLVCPTNHPDVLASFLALFYLGAVPISVSGTQMGQAPGSQLPFVAGLVVQTGARGVFTQPELVGGNDVDGLIPPTHLIDFVPSSLALGEPPAIQPAATVREDDLAFIQFSSGSTSWPKGVKISHRNVINNIRLLVESGQRRSDETVVAWLPLYHDMGLMGTLLATLWHCPTNAVILSPIRFLMRPLSWLSELSRYRARITVCPNFALDLCIDRIREEDLVEQQIDLSGLEMLFVGAEPVRPNSLRRFYERFSNHGLRANTLYPVYGLAEATLIVTSPAPGEPIVTRTVHGIEVPSVGRSLGDFKVRVVRDDGTDCTADETGEIWLQGASVSEGYLDSDANVELFQDGWLRTGDLGSRDAEQRLYITGRVKDLIIVNGKNYYAHDIVADLEELPFFERGKVAVFSTECGGHEQMIVMTVPVGRISPAVRVKIAAFQAFLKVGGPRGWLKGVAADQIEPWVDKLISSDRADLTNEIKRYVLARFGVPVHDVVFVRKIPRTTSGKLKRDACEQIYREQSTAPPADE